VVKAIKTEKSANELVPNTRAASILKTNVSFTSQKTTEYSSNKKESLVKSVNRIVIGDVGSGKTIVAFLIALSYLQNLQQGVAAMLAPTEVLAFQHFQKLVELKNQNPKLLAWLQIAFAGGKQTFWGEEKLTKGAFQKEYKKFLETDFKEKKMFWLGTHALLFKEEIKPDLVLIDEQHRFGVEQRQKLTKQLESGNLSPHFISFTATPIPRTLALTVYKNLKPHFLNTLENRKPVKTSIESFNDLDIKIVPKIKEILKLGQKVYIICAKVIDKEDAEESDIWSITKTKTFFEKYFEKEILTVHGKLTEKKDILKEFKESKEKNILIATTVVEVGVDVGAASLVVILNAERFGLAALHQIRGRVGRNEFSENFCYLVCSQGFQFSQRLKYLTQLNDGFKLAEKDLELRGGGDPLGKEQSGFNDEVNNLLGLNPELYYQISDLVDKLEFEKLDTILPRLSKYLEKEKEKVWGE